VKIGEFVGIIKTRAGPGGDVQSVLQPEGSAFFFGLAEDMAEVVADEVFHGDEIRIFHEPEVINLDDVLVVQEGGQFGLVDEGGYQVFFSGKVGQDPLDGDKLLKALRARDFGPVQLGHPSYGYAFQEEVFSKGSGFKSRHK